MFNFVCSECYKVFEDNTGALPAEFVCDNYRRKMTENGGAL